MHLTNLHTTFAFIAICLTAVNCKEGESSGDSSGERSEEQEREDSTDPAEITSKLPMLSGVGRTMLPKVKSGKLPYLKLSNLNEGKDSNEFWRDTEILSIVKNIEKKLDFEACDEYANSNSHNLVLPTTRIVRPICRSNLDYQLCPQCPHFSNTTECELFRDSCTEKRVHQSEYRTYCDKKYGTWRALLFPADYSKCRCCDECVFYRELDQSCMEDDNVFDMEETLPVSTIDFRAGCNPYWGHPEQVFRALRCDESLRRCVPITTSNGAENGIKVASRRTSFRYESVIHTAECSSSCRVYRCNPASVQESQCPKGAFIPDRNQCNCCGTCSTFQQVGEKCANFRKSVHSVNGSHEIEIEEELIEPGCDDGLVCRQGRCDDIHEVQSLFQIRRSHGEVAYEPCKEEMKFFKKKYGKDGHLHFEAPQCTSLWLYAPVQCRRFFCYCALEDGSAIEGIKVPRVDVTNMNCDCAREKCRSDFSLQCDGYGNYKTIRFHPNTHNMVENEYRPATVRKNKKPMSNEATEAAN